MYCSGFFAPTVLMPGGAAGKPPVGGGRGTSHDAIERQSRRRHCISAALLWVAATVLCSITLPRGALADDCTDAAADVIDIGTFNNCIRVCEAKQASQAVQCLPPGCKITLTMSVKSAQAACSLGNCQLPRVILDCPSKTTFLTQPPTTPPPIRPSFLLCPLDSSSGDPAVFGTDRIEVGQDQTRNGGSNMIMADIPIPPGTAYNGNYADIINNDSDSKGCNSGCHEGNTSVKIPNPDPGNLPDVTAGLSPPIPVDGFFGLPLSPFIISTQDPTLEEKVRMEVEQLIEQRLAQEGAGETPTIPPIPYTGTDGNELTMQNLHQVCDCIKADVTSGNFTIAEEAITGGNFNFDEQILLDLCEALKSYAKTRSCAVDPCVNADAQGKFRTSIMGGAVSVVNVDLSGNASAATDSINLNQTDYTFNNFDGYAQAFNYKTHTLVQMVFNTLTATKDTSGNITITGNGTIGDNASTVAPPLPSNLVNLTFTATKNGGSGQLHYMITASDSMGNNGQTVMMGYGEPGLSAVNLPGSM